VTDEEFLAAFEACTIVFPTEWTHRAHLRMAYLYLDRHPFEEALRRVRTGIQRFNAANRVPEGPDRGYHETLTQMWLRTIHGLREARGRESGFDAFLEQHPYLLDKRLFRLFYTRQTAMSDRAKREYVAPDLADFPPPGRPPA
jgi:hypothetical protein